MKDEAKKDGLFQLCCLFCDWLGTHEEQGEAALRGRARAVVVGFSGAREVASATPRTAHHDNPGLKRR